jgi:hypothetical protein
VARLAFIALLLSVSTAWAGDQETPPPDEPPTVEPPAPDEAPTVDAPAAEPPAPPSLEPTSCPDLRRCCVPGTEPCWHPKAARGLLLGGGVGAAGLGAVGWLVGGDTLGSGDPYGALIGIGTIAGAGAALGALLGALSPRGETAIDDRPGRPMLRFRLTPGGPSTIGESSPLGLSFSVDPTLDFGDVVRLQPHVGLSTGLGVVEHVDPRPQLATNGSFPLTDRQHRLKVSAGAELSIRLPYPTPKVQKPIAAGRIEIRYRPTVEVRRRTHHLGSDRQQIQEHVALYPLLIGFRWHTSPRQRFTTVLGPRLDWYGLTAPGSDDVEVGGALTGTFYAEAWYQVDVPMTPEAKTATSVNGRFNIGYVHSMLDGATLDVGAIIGFLGPVNVSYDLRIRRRGAPVAVQITGGIWLSKGGGPYVEVGLVLPDLVVPVGVKP